MEDKKFDIDLVYLWVNGNDPAWLARKRAFTGDFVAGSETDSRARYVVRYSLRSAEKYAPWIRRVFIVTDGQTPEWLDTTNPRVRIVDHTEILPPEALPCYNSSVINHYIYRIPGLSEHFLSANDDTFFGSPVEPDFFFAPDGYPIVRMRRKIMGKLRWVVKRLLRVGIGNYRTMVYMSGVLVEKKTGKFYAGVPHHNIDACLRSDYRYAVEEIFRSEIAPTVCHHTRTAGGILRMTFSYYAMAVGHAHARYVGRRESLRINVNRSDFGGYFVRFRPRLFCLNDNQRATDEDRGRIRPFLESLFPERSSFEK